MRRDMDLGGPVRVAVELLHIGGAGKAVRLRLIAPPREHKLFNSD